MGIRGGDRGSWQSDLASVCLLRPPFRGTSNLEPKQASYSVYTVRLVSLEPYPHIDRPIPDDAYVATLRVTRSDAD